MTNAALIYWKMKFWCCRPQGEAFAHCFKPHRGVVVRTAQPQCGAFAAFPNAWEGMGTIGIGSLHDLIT